MADGNFGERVIELNLNTPITARVIRAWAAPHKHVVKITKIVVNGVAGATGANGALILKKEGTGGGVQWQLTPANNEVVRVEEDVNIVCNGLYMDALTTAWLAGSRMLIYTA